jgi:hypothetical protein
MSAPNKDLLKKLNSLKLLELVRFLAIEIKPLQAKEISVRLVQKLEEIDYQRLMQNPPLSGVFT